MLAEADAVSAAPFVSVCIPVKNGEGRIEHCLASLRAQTYPADRYEIVLADGCSTDRTVEIARTLGARVVHNARQIVASGRNVAFAAASGEIIASTDDDCVLPPDWLATGVRYLAAADVAAVGGPSILPVDASSLSKAAGLIFRLAGKAGWSVQADTLKAGEVDDLPGCNVMYRRAALDRVGCFDEALLTAEDVHLHLRLRSVGLKLIVAPDLRVWHHKRDMLRQLFRQMRRFAIGRVQLGRRHASALRPIHILVPVAVPCLVAAATVLLVLAPQETLAGLASLWALSVGIGLAGSRDLATAIWLAPVAVIMVAGWCTGFWSECLAPLRDTAGR
jgi:succinoglycan biosynthesis protein ExoA